MEEQTLIVLFGAAATASVVAAALGLLIGRRAPLRSAVGTFALLAGVLAGSRLALQKWAVAPVVSAEWIPYVSLAAAAGGLLAGAAPGRWWWCRAAAAGAAAAAVTCTLALARLMARVEPAIERWTWFAGIALVSVGAAVIAGAAYRRVEAERRSAGPAHQGLSARLRDEHWPAVAIGLVLSTGAAAMLFAAASLKVAQLGLALTGAWAGVSLVKLLLPRALALSGAAPTTAAVYVSIWLVAYFTHDPPRPLALGLGLGALLALIIGTTGPIAQRGGWARLGLVACAGVSSVGVACAIHGPDYLREIRELQGMDGPSLRDQGAAGKRQE